MRNQWPSKFATMISKLSESNGSAEWNYQISRKQMWMWLLESLAPQELKAYEFIREQPLSMSAWNVAYELKVKHNHAATMLKSLYDLGLLERRRITDERGSFYMYKVKVRLSLEEPQP